MSDGTGQARPTNTSIRPLRALVPFLRPYRGVLVAAIAALLLASGAMLLMPWLVQGVLNHSFAHHDPADINGYFLGFFGVAVAFGAFAALRYYLLTWLGERVVADLRSALYRHLLRMDAAFFEVTRTGEVLSRLTADTALVQSITSAGLSITLRSGVNLVGALVMMAFTSGSLLGLLVLSMPFVFLPLVLLGGRMRRLSRQAQDRVADSSAWAGEALNGIQTVQAFNLEDLHGRRYERSVEQGFSTAVARTRVRAWMTAAADTCVFAAIAAVLWFGVRQVQSGSLSPGELGQFLLLAGYAGTALAALSEVWGDVQRAAGAMERLAELLEAVPAIVAPLQPVPLPDQRPCRLTFDNVGFEYPSRPGQSALKGVSLDIGPGEHVAFVGKSGSGKSTAFQLLLRLRDPDRGTVLIDGVDLSRADPAAIRQRIGLVPQDTVLFADTVRENIRCAEPGAADDRVEAAALAAQADAFVQALPAGYDTHLGERGARLSGGQRQRIAIARALLRDPPILLLDEATSALDASSEDRVHKALAAASASRTTVVIAHRLATAQAADRIVVFDQGRVAAQGTHEHLMHHCPLYAQLVALQWSTA